MSRFLYIHGEDSIVCCTCTGGLYFYCAGYKENSYCQIILKRNLCVMSVKWNSILKEIRFKNSKILTENKFLKQVEINIIN